MPIDPRADIKGGSTGAQPTALNLSAMVPSWARPQSIDGQADIPVSMVELSADVGGHLPTLPLPPAGASAVAMVGAALAAKSTLRLMRQAWRRQAFR